MDEGLFRRADRNDPGRNRLSVSDRARDDTRADDPPNTDLLEVELCLPTAPVLPN